MLKLQGEKVVFIELAYILNIAYSIVVGILQEKQSSLLQEIHAFQDTSDNIKWDSVQL